MSYIPLSAMNDDERAVYDAGEAAGFRRGIETAAARIAELEYALRFYAESRRYLRDHGNIARVAILPKAPQS